MRFTPMALPEVWLIQLDRIADSRGHFARSFCAESFAAHGLPAAFPQASVSFSARRATLRGLHWQDEPHPEGKLVRCTQGAIFDVAVDIRPASPTRGRFVAITLTAETGDALYIPPGFAHGLQTLRDGTSVDYQMTAPYHAALSRGIRWNDPALAIPWPIPDPILSRRDAALPLLA
jgi:dTDP-4-dehydrorhamnose 3,5-epimerase